MVKKGLVCGCQACFTDCKTGNCSRCVISGGVAILKRGCGQLGIFRGFDAPDNVRAVLFGKLTNFK